jgi:hypothetical protein
LAFPLRSWRPRGENASHPTAPTLKGGTTKKVKNAKKQLTGMGSVTIYLQASQSSKTVYHYHHRTRNQARTDLFFYIKGADNEKDKRQNVKSASNTI